MDQEPIYPFRIYFWKIRNEITGQVRRTRWRMTEQEALRYSGAVKIDADSLLIKGPIAGTGPTQHQSEK